MKRLFEIFFLATLFFVLMTILGSLAALADQGSIRDAEIVVEGTNLTKNLIVLVDCSDSMRSLYGKVPHRFKEIIELFGDDGNLRVYGFRERAFPCYLGKIKLPNDKKVKKAKEWLQVSSTGGVTRIARSVEQILLYHSKEKDLSVLLISDGLEMSNSIRSLDIIRRAQRKREAGPVAIHAYGLMHTRNGEQYLKKLTEEWNGWFLAERYYSSYPPLR